MKYFAFGSNLNLQQMKRRLGKLGNIAPGVPHILEDWKLSFNVGYRYTSNTFANIIYNGHSKVEGLIYDLNIEQFRLLEMYEALYDRRFFRLPNDERVWVFIGKPSAQMPMKGRKPFLDYVNIIIDGCKEAGFEKTYQELLEFKKQNYKLKKGNKHVKNKW